MTQTRARRNKYGAKPTLVDGIRFASKAEAARYGELRLLVRAGHIRNLELQPRFPLIVNGINVGTYIADFRYLVKWRGGGPKDDTVVEDVKGLPTPLYRLKKKLVEALHKITITEIKR